MGLKMASEWSDQTARTHSGHAQPRTFKLNPTTILYSLLRPACRALYTMAADHSLRIAVVQFAPKIGQVGVNIAKAKELCAKCVHFFIFPR